MQNRKWTPFHIWLQRNDWWVLPLSAVGLVLLISTCILLAVRAF